MKTKETLEQKVLRERKLKELSFEVDSLIVRIVKRVEEINSLKGIPEVKVGTRHFAESHEVLKMLGYSDSYRIVRFHLVLNKVSKWQWFWNPTEELVHKYYWDWGDHASHPNLKATVQMYEDLIARLELAGVSLENEIDLKKKIMLGVY
ncbi:MAG: hypothetical protein KBT03_13080 [Bacteroidales bacterium]|nr:hypothetical protein [Candidatus Scybalousia scybalohippi]